MRIFVTSHNCIIGGGVSVARNLIAALGRVAPQIEYGVTVPADLQFEESCQTMPKCKILPIQRMGIVRRWFWETFSLPKIAREFRPDVIFNMANRSIASHIAPQATLVQDSHLFYPSRQFGQVSLGRRLIFWYHKRHFHKSLKYTRLLFCQTPVARGRLQSICGPTTRIALCPNGVSVFAKPAPAGFRMPEALDRVKDKFRLFTLTRYYGHKNLEIIPEVFERYREQLRDVVVILTIRGDEHRQARKLLNRIQRSGLHENIIAVGQLQQEELGAYYASTDALFLPTLLESFSGTYLEAMAFGRPILTSGMDFARGVCGDAAGYFDPFDPASILQAIVKLRDDPTWRKQLAEAGLKRRQADSMSWDDNARLVVRELEELAASKPIGRAAC